MFKHEQLIHCQERKEMLLRQSAVHRLALMQDAHELRPVARGVDWGIEVARKVRAGWEVAALLVSRLRSRKQLKPGLAQRLLGAVTLVRSLTALWNGWR